MKIVSPIIVDIVNDKIAPENVSQHIANNSCGAEIIFIGTVRNRSHGRQVEALEYDAQVLLAKKTLKTICEEAAKRFCPELNAIVLHRTGKLNVGETSVAIGVSTPHRDDAYKASRYIIEELKARVPIWKKEFYTDGQSEWTKGCALCANTG